VPACLGQAQAVIFKPGTGQARQARPRASAGQAGSLKYTGRGLSVMLLLVLNKKLIFDQKM
jgi:hypothetical protein